MNFLFFHEYILTAKTLIISFLAEYLCQILKSKSLPGTFTNHCILLNAYPIRGHRG